jgi:uncharacterized protein YbbK (DUF523 family)
MSALYPREDPVLVSACLLGLRTTFRGSHNENAAVLALGERRRLVPFCPEQLGGLSTPRPPAEIQGGGGAEVLAGSAIVETEDGTDVTDHFLRGAHQAACLARLVGARGAVLKARSPSCGVGRIYDGTFSHRLRPGSGVAAALLEQEGVEVLTEEDLERAPQRRFYA